MKWPGRCLLLFLSVLSGNVTTALPLTFNFRSLFFCKSNSLFWWQKWQLVRQCCKPTPTKKPYLEGIEHPYKILISSIKTHWCHTGGTWKQNLKSTDESKAFDSEEIIKLSHFTGFQGVLATQGCSLQDFSYSLPSSRSFNTTRVWGKNSLGLRKPPMSILCLVKAMYLTAC